MSVIEPDREGTFFRLEELSIVDFPCIPDQVLGQTLSVLILDLRENPPLFDP
jgi:hypothetical protein